MKIIDVHTHVFPDNLAHKVMGNLQKANAPYKPFTDGTIRGLLASMDEAGITSSFILNIATKPEQIAAIIKWTRSICSDRIISLGSIHPDSISWQKDIDDLRKNGIKGIKFQPMYQKFAIDEKRMLPIYEYIAASKMFVIFHSGEDIAFPGNTQSSVDRIGNILKEVPRLKIIAAHFGGWRSWPAVLEHLCGKDVFLETSFIHEVDETLRHKIFSSHDRRRFLFGSDSPWGSQKMQVEFIKNLSEIDGSFKDGVFYENVNFLLNSLNE